VLVAEQEAHAEPALGAQLERARAMHGLAWGGPRPRADRTSGCPDTLSHMTYLVSLVASIDQRLDELAEEIAQLENARAALERAQLNGAGRRNGGTPRTRAPRRRAAPLNREELVRILGEAEDGLSASTIAEQTGSGYQATLSLLRELEALGTVRRVGSRRSTRWRVLSDEDWIAERAAELERLAVARS